MNIIFFGSTNESVIVLNKLFSSQFNLSICCVVTQPLRPVGRHQEMMPTPVEVWAKKNAIAVLSFPSDSKTPWLYENEQAVVGSIQTFKPDLLVSASYGQKIPTQTITEAKYGGLNVHPSLLPRWRGADPVPWAILSGDNQTGVTIVILAEKFDEGKIIAQKKIPILPTDTTKILYPKLFTLGADLLIQSLPGYLDSQSISKEQVRAQTTRRVKPYLHLASQGPSPAPYARRLTKQDGFVSWEIITAAMDGKGADEADRKFRAFDPWPGLWSIILIKGQEKRIKILKLHLQGGKLILDDIQLEGKNPTSFAQFSSAYANTS